MPSKTIAIGTTTHELARVIDNLRDITEGEDTATTLLACLGYAFILQHKTIKTEELLKAIDETSRWIAFYIENLEGIPKEKIT